MADGRGFMLQQVGGCAREQDLPATGYGANACRPVDGESDVAVAHLRRLARVKADAHLYTHPFWPFRSGQRLVNLDCRGDRRLRASENGEERVALTINLGPSMFAQSRTKHTVMRGDQLRIA